MSHCIQVWSPDKTWRRPTDGRDPGRRPPDHGRRGKVPRQPSEAGKKFVQLASDLLLVYGHVFSTHLHIDCIQNTEWPK